MNRHIGWDRQVGWEGMWRGLLMVATLLAIATGVSAQSPLPDRPVRIVVPFAPGGASDVTARLVATHLSPRIGRPVVVENKAGAATVVGSGEVARASADGTTLLLAPPPFVITQFAYPNLPYAPERDFQPISLLVTSPIVLVVPAASEVRTLPNLVAQARARPGALSFGSPGNGSLPHVALELLKLRAGIDMVHVPYRGGGPAVVDLMAGRLDALLASPLEVAGHVQSGRLRIIAVASERREADMPDVPTFAEGGVADFHVIGWFGLVAPAAVPAATIQYLSSEVRAVLALAEVQQRLRELGASAAAGSPEDFARLLAEERRKWAEAVAAARVRVE